MFFKYRTKDKKACNEGHSALFQMLYGMLHFGRERGRTCWIVFGKPFFE